MILLTVPSIDPALGGPSYTVPSLARGLSERGERVTLFTTASRAGDSSADLPFERVEVLRSHAAGGGAAIAPSFRGALRGFCLSRAVRLIHDNGLWTLINHDAAFIARRLRIPRVVSPRGMLTEWSLENSAWKKRLALALYQGRDLEAAAMFHATADDEVRDIRRRGLLQPIAVVPNGVDVPARRDRAPRSEGEDRVVLFMSRLHPKKGLPKLIEAWERLRPAGWRCVIAGPDVGGYRRQLENLIASKRLADRFAFTGFVAGEAKWDLLRRADVFALPTASENFGVVVAEALAAGTPVLTTKGTPWRELETRGCGWWVDTGADAVAEGLARAIAAGDEERARMGERGRALVEEKYSWRKIAADMAMAYRWLLGGGEKPACVRLD